MDSLTPAEITEATFRTTRKGFDPDEVRTFLAEAAQALEQARQHATAMEARARAAVARLQETEARPPEPAPAVAEAPPPEPPTADDDGVGPAVSIPAAEAETISRTLLLAQRTADSTIAEAEAEAERIVTDARSEAETTIDSTREMSAQMLEDARNEARKASDDARRLAENEVEALVARREFLVGDVDQLERFLIDQRDRLRGAARQIEALCERVPEGLGSVRPPILSASHDDDHDDDHDDGGDPTQELVRPGPAPDPTDATDTGVAAAATDSLGEPEPPLPDPTLPTEVSAPLEPSDDVSQLAGALDQSSGESGLPRRYPRS